MSKHILGPFLSIAAIVVSVTMSINCTSDRASFEDQAPNTGAAAEPSPFVAPDAAANDSGAVATDEECAGEIKLVYVFTRDAKIVRFDPATLTFTELGRVICPTSSDANSMAIDRHGEAWLAFTDTRVFNVPLRTLECTEVVLNWPEGNGRTGRFGMAFSKDDSETGESLFMGGNGLWKTDPRTLEVQHIGEAKPLSAVFELSGTGDGKLFGWGAGNGILGRLDLVSGNVLEWEQTNVVGRDWAFAQWGGDFWLFVQLDRGEGFKSTSVVRYSPLTRTSAVVVEDAGMIVVGAGSSTCAPYAPPK